MLPVARRLPLSLRRYASRVSQAPKKTTVAPPSPPPSTLKGRIMAAQRAHQLRSVPAPPPLDPKLSEQENQMLQVKYGLAQREKMKKFGIVPPPIELPLLDHVIPYAVSFKTRSEYPSLRAMYAQFLQNRKNDGKNAFAMRHIGVADSFPGVSIDPRMNWFTSTYLFTRRVLQAQSLKSAAWVAPMRQEFLTQYVKLNESLAKDSAKTIQSLTMKPYQDEIKALANKRPAGHRYVWTFHREVTPTRIISLRAADGSFDKEMPASGSRIGVQALVRFDTEQSVEIYDRQGKALHTPAHAAGAQPSRLGKTHHAVPAARKRVTEYLVLDKAMYELDAAWRFRARYTPTPGRTVAV